VIGINLEPTPISDGVDASLLGKAGDILPAIAASLGPTAGGEPTTPAGPAAT
jgi:hypothetical protein